jgi:aerobic-type carbon monoxide dehydrogenase small subunit (CoxS/CutS family)
MRSNCICPGYTVTFAECTVVGRPVGTTVWKGTAFDQCVNDELNLLHSHFGNQVQKCNNGSIIVQGLRVEEDCYTSELTITVSSDMIGKTVQCIHYDVNREISIGTLIINYSTGKLTV